MSLVDFQNPIAGNTADLQLFDRLVRIDATLRMRVRRNDEEINNFWHSGRAKMRFWTRFDNSQKRNRG